MGTVIIGAIANIILDPIFIFGFNMGVKGAALATIISQALSAIWVVKFLTGKKTIIRFRKKYLMPKVKILLPVFALGLSPFVMQSTEGLVNLALNISLQKHGGDLYVGAMTIISSIMQVTTMPLTGFGQGLQPIISYNYGAKNFSRVRRAYKLALICSLAFSITAWSVLQLFPSVFIAIFNNNPTLTALTIPSMRLFMAGVFIMPLQFVCQQTFLALGQAKISIFLALLRKVILLIPLAIILPNLFSLGVTGVFLSEPVADVTSALTAITIFSFRFPKILADAGEVKE